MRSRATNSWAISAGVPYVSINCRAIHRSTVWVVGFQEANENHTGIRLSARGASCDRASNSSTAAAVLPSPGSPTITKRPLATRPYRSAT